MIIVFVSHLEVILPIPRLAVVPGGTVSLDSFFVLSGFLITALMLREQARTKRLNTGGFYRRRAVRLLPPLLAVLVGQSVFAYLSGVSYHEEWTSLLSVGFYYSNWKLAFNSNALGGNIAAGPPASLVACLGGAVLPHLAVGDHLLPEHPRPPADRRHRPGDTDRRHLCSSCARCTTASTRGTRTSFGPIPALTESCSAA